MKRTSLKDIAEKLQLSQTAVSWVLTGNGDRRGISKATQDLVRNCAAEMNYQPNLIARSLNLGKTKTLGLIIPSISDFFYSSIAMEIEQTASKNGYSLMIASSESNPEKEENLLRTFRSKGVDGIIIAPTKKSKNEIKRLIKEKFPIVSFDRFFPDLEMSSIVIDNKESSYKLVRHLIRKGCKKIAVITTNPHLITMCSRVDGYKQGLEEAGIDINPDLIGCVTYDKYELNIINVLDAIFEKEADVDGFFFTTHILALEAFLYFNKKGINFNEKFGLACIHSVSTFEILAPYINVAEMPVKEIGEKSVNILLESIESKKKTDAARPYNLVLPCTLLYK